MKTEIDSIENRIFNDSGNLPGNSFLVRGLDPVERIIRYNKSPEIGFQYICARHKLLSFKVDAAYVTLLPEEREKLVKLGEEMMQHGVETGRFLCGNKRILADIIKGATGEYAGCTLFNAVFESFGLETRLEINKLKYDGRGDGGRDAVVGLYGIDFKYRNDVTKYTDLVVSSFDLSPQCILVHTHSARRKDDKNYDREFYLNVNGSSHLVVIRGGISGARFSECCKEFENKRKVLENYKEFLVPVWDLVLFFVIQAAKQEGYVC